MWATYFVLAILLFHVDGFTPRYMERKLVELVRLNMLAIDKDSVAIGTPHTEMTRVGVRGETQRLWGFIEDETTPMILARLEIEEWSARVDDPEYGTKDISAAHFDGERFEEGQQRLMDLRRDTIAALRLGNTNKAREALGSLLHTLQDFYAHSNWVELLNDKIHPEIGNVGGKAPVRQEVIPTCRDCVTFFDSLESKALYDRTNQCLNACKLGAQDKTMAFLTTACLLGVYNGGDPAISLIPDAAARKLGACRPYECTDNLFSTSNYLTSGYYYGSTENNDAHTPVVKPANKCSHGGYADGDNTGKGANGLEGINKDTMNPMYSPHYRKHPEAARLAKAHTKDFLEKLSLDLTDSERRLLYGVGSPSLSFVVDVTTSMTPILNAVRTTMHDLVIDRRGTLREPVKYILVPFSDPLESANVFSTTNADEFLNEILRLDVYGGGTDCPEPSIEPLYRAVEATPDGGSVFLFTDAGAKDYLSWRPRTIELAIKKQIRIFPFIFESNCLPDEYKNFGIYEYIAERTGGDNYAVQVASATQMLIIAEGFLEPNFMSVWSSRWKIVRGAIGLKRLGRRQAEDSVSHSIDIDDTVQNVTFALSGRGTMDIVDPDGTTLTSASAGVRVIKATGVSNVFVQGPKPGVWKAILTKLSDGDGFNVYASGANHLSTFEFAEERGAHPGLFPITRPLVPGEELPVVASINRPDFASASFELRSVDGRTVVLIPDVPRGSGKEFDLPDNFFMGRIVVPEGQFYVHVIGQTRTGHQFRRCIPTIFGTAINEATRNTTTTSAWNSTTVSTSRTVDVHHISSITTVM
jgi:hypothetical protein